MKKTILITGAGGFVGANLVRYLITENFNLHVIVRSQSSLWRLKELKNKITVHKDLLQYREKLSTIIKKISPCAIYHLSTHGAYPNQNNTQDMINTNIISTQNLLDSLINVPYQNLVVTGSSSEYGNKLIAMKESDLLEPNNAYAATKTAQTLLCQTFAKTFHKPVIILRLFNVYGPFEEKGRLVRSVIESAIKGDDIKLATGQEARDLIYVEDVVDACIRALSNNNYYGEIFNIGTGKQTTILDLAKKVKKLLKSKAKICLGVYKGRIWDSNKWKADMTKTKKIFGWSPKYSLNEGLIKTIYWYKENLNVN